MALRIKHRYCCPHCKQQVNYNAETCPHCGTQYGERRVLIDRSFAGEYIAAVIAAFVVVSLIFWFRGMQIPICVAILMAIYVGIAGIWNAIR